MPWSPPAQGGRGLKFAHTSDTHMRQCVAPRTGGRGLKYSIIDYVNRDAESPPAQGGVD